MPEVIGHSGENQWEALLPILKDYGIIRNIGAVVGDNSGTNDTLCHTMSAWLAANERINWSAGMHRMRCSCHFINLFVQAFLIANQQELDFLESYEQAEVQGFEGLSEKELKEYDAKFRALGVLGKLHIIVVHIRGSPARTKRFEDRAGRRIPLDNRTRWNSWFTMLDVTLELQPHVSEYISDNIDSIHTQDQLTPQDWQLLRTIHKFLEMFKSVTKMLEMANTTLDQVVVMMDTLKRHYKQTLVCRTTPKERFVANNLLKDMPNNRLTREFRARVVHSKAKFDTYYKKLFSESPLYTAAVILHPNYRTKYCSTIWDMTTWNQARFKVQRYWESWRREAPPIPSYDESLSHQAPKSNAPLDALHRIQAEMAQEYARPKSQDEFENYCAEVSYGLKVEDGIQWWLQKEQVERWPQLSRFAVNILSIPTSSTKPEISFSGGRRTSTWDRGQLLAQTLEVLECEKDWIRSGILKRDF